jgi:hypothetical protein
MTRSRPARRRGLSLLELILGLAMTTLVAGGVTGMLAGLGSGIAVGRDARTSMLAASATQRRVLDELTDHAALLETSPERAVLWQGDLRPGGSIEASELVWLSADDVAGLVVERMAFPENWTTLERAMVDRRVHAGDDLWSIAATLRGRGVIERRVLADGLVSASLSAIDDRHGVRIDLGFDLPTGRSDATVIVPIRNQTPEAWR